MPRTHLTEGGGILESESNKGLQEWDEDGATSNTRRVGDTPNL
jgi:hypothetical protein